MKNLSIFLVSGVLFMFFAFSYANDLGAVKKALKAGDAASLGQYIGANIEIEIDGEVDYFSKEEAVKKLQVFFQKNKVVSFSEAHQGSTKDNSAQFLICHLDTTSGKYRVYLMMKTVQNRFLIQEMNFTKE